MLRRLRPSFALARLALALALVALATGCSSVRPWINAPLQAGPRIDTASIAQRDSSALIAVTLSGGGARAAAFGYGVLQELRDTRCCWNDRTGNLLDSVDLVSGVSGGSIVAAYYAAFGAAGLDGFERDFLRQDFQHGLISQTLRPGNLFDLTSPWFGRSQLLERRLDELYRGTTFGDIARRPRHPQLVVTATDMSLGTGFDFTADQFELICSDLDSLPLSFAVTASSAVPLVLSPMTLRNYRDKCPAGDLPARPADAFGDDYRARLFRAQERSYVDATARPYIHLVDGGLADNLGVRRLLDRALTSGSMGGTFNEVRIAPGSIKRLVIITVNAERDSEQRIDQSDRVPDTAQVVDALLFGTGNRASDETQGYLADIARRWQDDMRSGHLERFPGFAADAQIFLVPVNLRDAPAGEARSVLLKVPTAFSISDAEVTRLIAAGRGVLRASIEFQGLRKSLGLPPVP
ncbi:MAG: patatin-like phospholipase family protein [Pseudomonadota bacterium]|nr:patatin-like phospholipase family protein [Pseudomonadota bacterium]